VGDREEELLGQFCVGAYPRLVAALTHYCGDVYLGEEFAQEALVVACRRWATVSRLDDPVAWTYRVGVNKANSWFRRARVERRARQRAVRADGDVHRDPDSADRIAVRKALDDLSPKQREAVILRFFLDLSAEQAAQLTGSSPGAVRGLTHRALAVLRDGLDLAEPKEATDAS
jgi:RNA polymerase sigma factor (sigma-70 family)